jgi:hypothetical protein
MIKHSTAKFTSIIYHLIHFDFWELGILFNIIYVGGRQTILNLNLVNYLGPVSIKVPNIQYCRNEMVIELITYCRKCRILV